MRFEEVIALFADLEAGELTSWVERGWVRPEDTAEQWEFREIDVARVQLIRDLRREMEVTEETIAMVLPLLDQLYQLRSEVRRLLRAIAHQPEAVRAAIWEALGG
jgi:chaperone modulatory protein CbpM